MEMENDPLANLIAKAGPRPQPSAEAEAEVRAIVYQTWQETLRREGRRRAMWFSVAAAAMIAFAVVWRSLLGVSTPPVVVATLIKIHGNVAIETLVNAQQMSTSAGKASDIYEGDEIDTRDGNALLTLGNEANVRLADHTHIRWRAKDTIELLAGALYIDSGSHFAPLLVNTPYGVVSHLGTRYQIKSSSDALSVSVREGQVEVKTIHGLTRVDGRQSFQIDTQGLVTRREIQSYGSNWAWADDLAPRFDIENRRLSDFLEWVAAQTGHTLEYCDAATRAAAAQTILHGTSESLTPAQSLSTILPTTDFGVRYDKERIIVQRR